MAITAAPAVSEPLSAEDQGALNGALISGERVLWAGAPDRRFHLGLGDLYALPFAAFFLAF
jgi:hypothetical protein